MIYLRNVFVKCTYHLGQSYWCQLGNLQSFQNDKLPRHWSYVFTILMVLGISNYRLEITFLSMFLLHSYNRKFFAWFRWYRILCLFSSARKTQTKFLDGTTHKSPTVSAKIFYWETYNERFLFFINYFLLLSDYNCIAFYSRIVITSTTMYFDFSHIFRGINKSLTWYQIIVSRVMLSVISNKCVSVRSSAQSLISRYSFSTLLTLWVILCSAETGLKGPASISE